MLTSMLVVSCDSYIPYPTLTDEDALLKLECVVGESDKTPLTVSKVFMITHDHWLPGEMEKKLNSSLRFTVNGTDPEYTADKGVSDRYIINHKSNAGNRIEVSCSVPDVIKTLQMLPGITPGNDNLYLMDNVPIYQSGHFLGLFSVFNTDMVESVDFYKGGFPAQFGGRASSVVDVRLKGSRDKITFNTYVGFNFMSFNDSSRIRDNVSIGGDTSYEQGLNSHKDANRWGNLLLSAIWERDLSAQRKMTSTYYVTDGYYHALYEDINEFTINDKAFKEYSLENKERGRYNEERLTAGRHYHSPELVLYAEDEFAISSNIYLNAGLRYMLFITKNKAYNTVEPRFALSYNPSRKLSLKLAYSEMSQPVHQLESFKTESPGSFWMPATANMEPIHARLASAETEWRPNRHFLLDFACFWKTLDHLYEYTGNQTLPSPAAWELEFTEGKGRSYGFEFYGEFQNERWEISTAYTLSWSQRYFEAFYHDWYHDRYDNRHNIVINGIYKAHQLIDMYVTWTLRSGNRYTIPLYGDQYYHGESLYPNNFQMPTYHRLDAGINFRAKTAKKGRDYIVTFAVYNLYGRKNPFYMTLTEDVYNRPAIKMTSIFPILPSIRYTMYF